ncbi:MAG: carboxypeptidase-like regulatory domain-containing protein [Draconibacterium sp.]
MKKNVSSLQCVLIALCSLFPFISTQAQTNNFIATGDMESSNWTGIPGNTNLTTTFDASSGINGTTSYKTVTNSMGGDSYYILRCEEFFHMDQSDKITVSFWAKGSVANMRLQPWVQEADGNQWMNFGDAYLTTAWKQYRFTVTLSTQTSDNYKIKFRGYHTGTMYIDNVQIGPVDYENVNQSGIYEVTVSQNGMTWPLVVFRNSCPTFQQGYQNMESKDQHPLDLFSGRTINWTKFSFDDPITVHVKVIDTNKVPVSGQTVNIYPSRHGVTSSTSGNVVTFTISEPGQYSVEIGTIGYKNGLMIFADPSETDIPSQSDPNYLVLYEATSNDVSSIPTSYSGIYFRRGAHNVGIWNIPDHIKNVYFEDGSWVYGALKMDGNPDVRIYGRGVLSSYNMNYRQTHCVEESMEATVFPLKGWWLPIRNTLPSG